MTHFASPLVVSPKTDENAVRVSVRASESRIDEWTITAEDVSSVLSWANSTGWRGDGELRVLVDRTGGSVAFHSTSGDRVIIRGPESMVHSFLAHLEAAHASLPGRAVEGVTVRSIRPRGTLAAAPEAQEALSSIQNQVAQNHSELLQTISRLSEAVQRALLTPSVAAPVLGSERSPTPSESVFIPSVSSTIEGTGMTASEKTSSADDLAASSAALRAAKKQTTSPQESQ